MEDFDPVQTAFQNIGAVGNRIGVLAITGASTYAINAARGIIRPAGPPAENAPKRQKNDANYNPYKRINSGNINNRDTKRQRNVQRLLGNAPPARERVTYRPVMAYGKRRRTSFKRGGGRRVNARRRPPVRTYRRKSYAKKTYRAKKSTITAARLLATMLK